MSRKIKSFMADDRIFYSIVILIVAGASFGLGRLSVQQSVGESAAAVAPVVFTDAPVVDKEAITAGRAVVGSKKGTKYHLPTCTGASQIAEENKITFASEEEARSFGYSPAGNCPELH